MELKKNEVLYMRTENGGGYGDPLERDAGMVAKDVKEGLVSQEAARDVYGVVVGDERQGVDLVATQRLRMELRKNGCG
jgi:N-methylhydantoinase B